MTTVNLKTVTTAPEPDRTKKYVAHGEARTGETKPTRQDPLKYVADLGWTWDRTPRFYTWDEYVDKFHAHFPLEEKELKVQVLSSGAELKLTDVGADKLELMTDGFNVLVKAERSGGTRGYDGSGFVLNPQMAGQLLTYLQEVLEITD